MGNKIVKNQVSNELSELAILLEGHINQFLGVGKQISTLLASERHIKKELELFNKDELNRKSAQKKLCQYLNTRWNLLDSILSITILNKKGIVIASSNNTYLGDNRSDSPYYEMGKSEPVISDVYFSKEYECGVIDYIAPILSEHKGTFIGILIIQADKSELDRITTGEAPLTPFSLSIAIKEAESNRIKKRPGETETIRTRRGEGTLITEYHSNQPETQKIIRKGSTREAYLVNKDKLMLTASRFMKDTFLKQAVNTEAVICSFDTNDAFSGIYKDYRGEWVLGFSRFIKEPGWVLLVETNLYETFLPIKKVRHLALIVFGSSVGCIIILTSLVSLRIVRHVLVVEKAIKNISSGNLNTHVDYDLQTGDELSRLTASFNEMALAVKQSKDALRDLFDAANDPMFIIKEDERIADMNKRVTEVFGYDKDELIGSNLTRILRTTSIARLKEAIASTWKLPSGQKYPRFDVFVITQNGKEMICALDLNRTAYGIQPHFRDVTKYRMMSVDLERKKQELEVTLKNLKETQAQLIQAGKLAGIGELASGVAHEINNPLTAVMGHALRLLRKTESEELKDIKALDPFRTELKIIADASLRCKRITDGLLKFSRVSAELKSSNLNVNAVVDDTLLLIENTLEQKKIKLIKQFDPHLKYSMGDHNQLQQVFTNIINNAIHAMPDGGSILIATRGKENPGKAFLPEVGIGEITNNKYIEVEFTDTGCGIKEEHISKIFDPFFTTKEPGKGTGLGLSISYSIIKDHKGWIDVKSTVGKGTTFLVMLPTVENINKVQDKKIIT